ncbi:MAG: vWA domain-containing protein [Planctomycetota bacterium]
MTMIKGERRRSAHGQSRQRRGATIVLLAILLPVLLLLAGIAINVAYMEMNRTELYVATDAAARAGGRDFAINGNEATAKAVARDASSRNTVAGVPLRLADSDFVFGESIRSGVGSRYTFTPGGANPNAVQITARRNASSLDGPIRLLMPRLLGVSNFNVEVMSESTQIEVDVCLVLDRSGSMAYAADEAAVYPPNPAATPVGWSFCDAAPDPSRWRDAVLAVNVFLGELSNSPASERVALCTYNTTSTIDQSLTSNYGLIMTGMDGYTQSFCSGYTDIGGGIKQATNAFAGGSARPWASKVIVVLTDGIQTAPGGGTNPKTAAKNAAAQGIMIFTVTFSDEANQPAMQRVAQIGLGKHFHAATSADLVIVFREIAKSLPTLLTQ